ncbi:MAG: methyltransferase domain-containing protein [Actinobacteria bacterium]|uniref:Unannotated protein n=1 Tax=freshwater metagenome TaxID=449393 RepID=A0A6J6US25_9ZZZZ|nr:methyltransferase domain-containing protein [Actinomycetota bacterium]
MEQVPSTPGFDAGTYGQSFADVYDTWYPTERSTHNAVTRLNSLSLQALQNSPTAGTGTASEPRAARGAARGARLLELGIGTGRLALPLAEAGFEVHGMDSSGAMLEQLRLKPRAAEIALTLGDVADRAAWPKGPFDLVLAAFNLLFNLSEEGAQASLFLSAAQALAPNGLLVVEAFIPAPLEVNERRLSVKEVTAESVVLIATAATASTGEVTGQHIELRDGQPVRLRPWRIRVATPTQLDELAAAAGLELQERHSDWSGTAFDPQGTAHVSVYRLRPSQA